MENNMWSKILSSTLQTVGVIFASFLASTAAAQNRITYEKVVFVRSISADDRSWSKLLFAIDGFRIDGSCYHDCDISFSLDANTIIKRADLSVTQDLVVSWFPTGSDGQMVIGNRENTANERVAISAFSEREKLTLAWIIEHSAELISLANATDRISPDVADFWRGQEEVFPTRIEKVFSTVLRGLKGGSETRNTSHHARSIIQPALAKLGLYSGPIDGVAGPMTRAAVSAFQNESGRLETGYVDSEELRLLAEILEGKETVEETEVDPAVEHLNVSSTAAAQHRITYEKVVSVSQTKYL